MRSSLYLAYVNSYNTWGWNLCFIENVSCVNRAAIDMGRWLLTLISPVSWHRSELTVSMWVCVCVCLRYGDVPGASARGLTRYVVPYVLFLRGSPQQITSHTVQCPRRRANLLCKQRPPPIEDGQDKRRESAAGTRPTYPIIRLNNAKQLSLLIPPKLSSPVQRLHPHARVLSLVSRHMFMH